MQGPFWIMALTATFRGEIFGLVVLRRKNQTLDSFPVWRPLAWYRKPLHESESIIIIL